MGFVKGTDGIARTVRNPLEGSIGDITLNDVGVATLTASGNVNGGNVISTALVRGVTVQATGNLTGGNANITTSVNTVTVNATTVTASNVTATGNVSGNTGGFAIGYRDIPQISFTGNTTTATTDAGKHYYSTQSTSYILTVANNASQGFQVGAAMTLVNQGTGNITVAQGSGVTLYMAGNATAGNRTVSTFGMATLLKVATNTWFINGTGIS